MKRFVIPVFIILSLITCESESDVEFRLESVSDTLDIPDYPINMYQINSKFDEYNSYVGVTFEEYDKLIFSTNRNTTGKDFDLVSYIFRFIADASQWDTTKYSFFLESDTLITEFLSDVNSGCDELGPYLYDFNPDYYPDNDSILFFVTRKCNRNTDILFKKYMHGIFDGDFISVEDFKVSEILNSEFDDGYVSISNDFKKLYFCSNKGGDFDIYQLFGTSGSNIYNILYNDSDFQINALDALNSNYDDKCPFIGYNLIVFTSNREGGFGGYDLYYSKLIDENWCAPVNFGNIINTEFDEFRPVVYKNKIMIFSSNRPGGKGGFDLYVVRI